MQCTQGGTPPVCFRMHFEKPLPPLSCVRTLYMAPLSKCWQGYIPKCKEYITLI